MNPIYPSVREMTISHAKALKLDIDDLENCRSNRNTEDYELLARSFYDYTKRVEAYLNHELLVRETLDQSMRLGEETGYATEKLGASLKNQAVARQDVEQMFIILKQMWQRLEYLRDDIQHGYTHTKSAVAAINATDIAPEEV